MACVPNPRSDTGVVNTGNSDDEKFEVCRLDIVQEIFGDVGGTLLADYSCAVESHILLHGRIFITDQYLCFYSNLFGLEKKIRIPYSHIILMSKENTALVIPNAIAISTQSKNYLFRSFWDRDDCYNLLCEQITKHNTGVVDEHREYDQETVIDSNGNTPSTIPSNHDNNGGKRQGDTSPSGRTQRTVEVHHGSIAVVPDHPQHRTSTVSQGSTPSQKRQGQLPRPNSTDATTPPPFPAVDSTSKSSSPSLSDQCTLSEKANQYPVCKIRSRGVVPTSLGRYRGMSITGKDAGKELIKEMIQGDSRGRRLSVTVKDETHLIEQELETATALSALRSRFLRDSTDAQLKLLITRDCPLPVDMTAFLASFVLDDAEYSYKRFHEEHNDRDVEASLWTGDATDELGCSREIRFVKPINMMGVAFSRAKKLQKYRSYGSEGLILSSSTRLEDVPFCDCFSVEDVLAVRPSDDNEKHVLVCLSFEVRFLKTVLFKGMIEGNTNPEMTKWLKMFIEETRQTATRISSRVTGGVSRQNSNMRLLEVAAAAAVGKASDSTCTASSSATKVKASGGTELASRDGMFRWDSRRFQNVVIYSLVIIVVVMFLFAGAMLSRMKAMEANLVSLQRDVQSLVTLLEHVKTTDLLPRGDPSSGSSSSSPPSMLSTITDTCKAMNISNV